MTDLDALQGMVQDTTGDLSESDTGDVAITAPCTDVCTPSPSATCAG
eukprot:CAMPEP_0185021156 /NCGR_PEP_ID=MMETSP1103-20130426/3825_1 /TAXON_ID=36769 /ORGANISM="Paraphysomonas bandaiensis, Strain Caron Lab Isolate" /LENGTH=46 /DNA_ID= /DNA_START= /DNA_END= /DNA_ORIENTATION=